MRHPSTPELLRMQRTLNSWFSGRSFPWRRDSASPYDRIISEVLLQRTRADVVGRFLPGFLKRYPSWRRLATATEADLQKILQPLGLWRRRAASLVRLADAMVARNGRLPNTRSDVESLPGVGQYVCNAVMLFKHRHPEPLLDVNMARVIERCFGPRTLADIRFDRELQEISRRVVSGRNPFRLNWAILDIGATLCTQGSPHCVACPLNQFCDFRKSRSPKL